MMVVDKTGRKLKIGQICDVFLMGMFQGQLVKIVENPISVPTHAPIPPHIVLMVTITPFIAGNGLVPEVYIIGEPDPKAQNMTEMGLLGSDGRKLD